MIVVPLPSRRIDRRMGEPFDNAALALKAAFDVRRQPIDLVNERSLMLLRAVPRSDDRPAPPIAV